MADITGSFQHIVVRGNIISTCEGAPQGPVLERSEMTWCGKACEEPGGLRSANSGLAGRNGLLLDSGALKYYATGKAASASYPYCKPEQDGFIQSINSDLEGEYSFYALENLKDSVLGDGCLKGSDLSLTFLTDRSEVDLLAEEKSYALIGPKSLINKGLSGPISHTWYYNDGTEADWVPEAGMLWETDAAYLYKGLDTIEAFDVLLGDRSSPHILCTTNPEVKTAFWPIVEIDSKHVAVARLVDAGTSYDVYIDLHIFNFVTEVLDLVESHLLWTGEPKPVEFAFGANRLVFAPTHGANGVLYVGQPNYTGSKSDEGRIHKLLWTGSAFTIGPPITLGIRVAYIGCCLGWDGLSDYLVFGKLEDFISTISDSGVLGPEYDGGGKSELGLAFSMGDEFLIAWDVDTQGSKLLQLDTSWLLRGFFNGYSYQCNTPAHPSVYYPFGRSGERVPRLTTVSLTNRYVTFYKLESVASMGWVADLESAYSWGRTTENEHRAVGWNTSSLFTKLDPTGNWGPVLDTFKADPVSEVYRNASVSSVFYDGADKEFLVYFYTDSSLASKRYNTVEITKSNQPHVQVGKHYVKSSFDVLSGNQIISASIETLDLSVTTGCYIGYFLQFDGDLNFYVPNDLLGLDTYASLEDARTQAADISTWPVRMPSVPISSISTLHVYFVFEKLLSDMYPTGTPRLKSAQLEIDEAGLAEPEICLHFDSAHTVREVYKTSLGVLVIKTSAPAQAAGMSMVVSGTPSRPLYAL